jgi:hypothetical protein
MIKIGIVYMIRSDGSLDGFVYAINHRQIPEIVNELAQPYQPISIAIRFRSRVDDDVRSRFGDGNVRFDRYNS